ncbi:MAG: InlB B-repeat-containing protein [Turicibacter sp.]|nr:InlB B-repeat-containing protein [Turicibacter sp.]
MRKKIFHKGFKPLLVLIVIGLLVVVNAPVAFAGSGDDDVYHNDWSVGGGNVHYDEADGGPGAGGTTGPGVAMEISPPAPEGYHNLSFNLHGGSGNFPTQHVRHRSSPVMPSAEPVKEGHQFEGWFISATVGPEFNFETIVIFDTTIHARWTPNEDIMPEVIYHQVLFDFAGGIGDSFERAIQQGIAFTMPTAVPVREGYYFEGWFVASADEALGAEVYIEEDMTIYARWTLLLDEAGMPLIEFAGLSLVSMGLSEFGGTALILLFVVIGGVGVYLDTALIRKKD